MIINDKEYGKFDVYLSDDGTLDTVIEVYNSSQLEGKREIRFSQEYAADFRDNTGAMTNDGFNELVNEAVEAYIEQYLI
jgi:hypothetical protein